MTSWRFGGAQFKTTGPGADPIYGPTNGRAGVIAGAAPRTVVDPGNTILFSSAADLQAKINANPSSSNFKPSVSLIDWSTRVLPSTKDPRIWCPGPVGTFVFDAGGRDLFSMIGANNGRMEVHGGTWRNCGTTVAGHGILAGPNSIVHDVDVYDCWGAGLRAEGNACEIGYFKSHDNGQDGVANATGGSNTLVHHGERYGNGYRDPDAAPDHGGSGKYSGGVTGNVQEYMYDHEDFDYGAWNDNTGSFTYRESVAEDCRKNAPFFELTQQGGLLSRCWLARNGETMTGGEWFNSNVTCIAVCDTVVGKELRVEWNHIEGAERLLAINNQTGRPNTKRVKVFDNRFRFTNSAARIGGQDSQSSGSRTMHLETPSNGGTFEFNRNLYECTGSLFTFTRWPTSSTDAGSDQTWAQWQALGFDLNSVREII